VRQHLFISSILNKQQKTLNRRERRRQRKFHSQGGGGKPVSTAQSLLEQGFRHYQSGQVDQAEDFCRCALREEPDNSAGLNFLATITNEKGNINAAIELMEKAVSATPENPQFLNNLGQLYKKNGRLEEALEAYGNAIRAEPNFAEAHNNLGNALQELGRFDAAVASYDKAISIKPDFIIAHSNMGVSLHSLGRLDEAITSLQKTLALAPDFADGHNNLGTVFEELGCLEDAVASYNTATTINPDSAKANYNLGNALRKLGRREDAIASYNKAITLNPNYTDAHNNLGNTFKDLGRLEDAIRSFRKAVALDPEYAEAHANLGRALLLDGQLKEGWEENEWRFLGRVDEKLRDYTQPPWQGQNLQGKTILVSSEQGIGDEVMFAGQVGDLLDAGAHVVLECVDRLRPVFERSFPGVECIFKADPPATTGRHDIDFQISGASLGRWLRPDVESYPGRKSYLLANGGRRDEFREKYRGESDNLLVGLAWNSNKVEIGTPKSLPLAAYGPLTDIPGLHFIDLQYGDTAAERAAFKKETGVEVFHDPDIEQLHDLDAFSAQVAAMDLIISISTTVAHFAGALGVPTWVLLNTVPLSCWMREGETSHLYPSVKLYRQTQAGEWADVVDAVKRDLSHINPN